jgi:hypothetical protein
LVTNPEKAKPSLRLRFLSCGNKDGLTRVNQDVYPLFEVQRVPHAGHVNEHAHDN